MDLNSVLHFISSHNELLIGIFLALAFITGILILIVPSDASESSGKTDLKELEATLQKLLAQHSTVAATSAAASAVAIFDDEEGGAAGAGGAVGAPDAAVLGDLNSKISERDKKILILEKDLQSAKTELTKAMGKASPGSDPAEVNTLKVKLKDLETRLKEYEIIEDDIADLTMYKEENQKLKAQLESMRGAVAPAAPAAPAPTATVIPLAAEPITVAKSEPDDVMKEFAETVASQTAAQPALADAVAAVPVFEAAVPPPVEAPVAPKAAVVPEAVAESPDPESPLGGTLDTAKMLSEVEDLSAVDTSSEDALADLLDTDKLLAEVSALGPEEKSAAAPAAAPAPAASTPAPAPAADFDMMADSEDDLMSEFKDLAKENR